MNLQQEEAVEIALSGHNLLLLGKAGTGKSFVINELAKRLTSSGKHVQITCSTGIACRMYNDACTTHQFTGISDGRYDPSEIADVIKNNVKYQYVLTNLDKIDTLIVDECSMISARVFDRVNNVCRIKNPECLFGGIQMIFCGDFLQLPPVANISYGDEGKFCFQSEYFPLVFPHRVTLTQNIRQTEEDLIKAIDEVSFGKISEDTENFILTLHRPLENSEGSRTVKLFSTNDLVDDYNRSCLLQFPGNLFESKSLDQGKASALSAITAPHTLWLKIGCPVILLRNLSSKLVNGLQEKVTSIDIDGPVVEFPEVEITTRLQKIRFSVYSPQQNTDIAVREQYPVKLAFGLTIHKAQGMTLDRVEIDCRDIFRSGQLSVAMSRATTAAGLQVINYHPRYVKPSPKSVTEFMNDETHPVSAELDCCRENRSSHHISDIAPGLERSHDHSSEQYTDIEDIPPDATEETLDDEFNSVIESIVLEEEQSIDFEIPDGFNVAAVLENMKFQQEITSSHTAVNGIINTVDHAKLDTFTRKVFMKCACSLSNLTNTKGPSNGIPEKHIAKFYRSVHEYTTSTEYKMNCLLLFDNSTEFSDNHMIVCYNIVEAVRKFYLQNKVDLLKVSSGKMDQRHVTDASRARIRYVAGYCISSLRKKYTKIKRNNMYSANKDSQDAYDAAKYNVYILNLLKEDENYTRNNTDEPDSLIHVERRQYVTKSLTNVTDNLIRFFVCLTEKSLTLLVHENIMLYGKNLFNKCLETISSEESLYEQFANIVATSHSEMSVMSWMKARKWNLCWIV